MSTAEPSIIAHRYRSLRTLGRGGMGEVWLAEDMVAGSEVALKVLTAQLATNQASILQVRQEFRLMTQLRHPNCCEVYEYGFLGDGQPFFTMEVVPGEGLDALLPLSPQRFKPLFVQLLQALSYVHQRGYIHCDLKSENVRVKPDGTLKLMDFGLMVNGGASGLPIRGTLGYLPPEVIKRGAIDQRSDLYAAGCLAFEVLTGQLPFVRAKPMEVLQAHLNDAPPIPGRLLDDDGCDWAPLIARLMAKEPLARYQAAEDVLEALGVSTADGLGGSLLASQLVGREPELQLLQDRLDGVGRGEAGGAVVLEGPEGMGKTRLVAELRIRAQLQHVPFGSGACYRQGASPLGSVVAALRTLLPAAREGAPALLERHAPVLQPLLPELGVEAAEELESPDKEKARLFGAIADLLVGLAAETGLVLALEDWQWADALSAEFLAYLLRNLGEAPLMVLLTMYQVPAEAPWRELAATVALDGLDPAASARLMGSVLGTDDVPGPFLAKMQAITGGNPQLLEGALRHLVETLVLVRVDRRWIFTVDWDETLLPANRLGLLHRRMAFLGDEALMLARVVSVIGKPTDLAELLAVSGYSEERLFAALDQLLEHQILRREEGGGYVLEHEMLFPLLYDHLDPEERRRLHGVALSWLETQLDGRPPGQQPLELVSQLARHAFGCADHPRAIRYALEAGKRSTMIYANAEAARLLESGLALVRQAGDQAARLDYVRFLADVYRTTGRLEEALPLYDEAVALTEAAGDHLTLGRVLTSMAKLHLMGDQLDAALAHARRALEVSARVGHGPVTLRAMLTEIRALFYMGRTQEATALADEALVRARALDQPTLVAQALSLRGYLEVASPEPEIARGVGLLEEASARFAELGDRVGLRNATDLLGNALMSTGDYLEARRAFETTRQLAFELGAKDDETFAWLNLALVALELGGLREAAEAAEKAHALATAMGSKFTEGMAAALCASARALRGEPAGAIEAIDGALALARSIKSKYMEMLVRQQQVETLLHLGDFAAADEAVRAWRALKEETGNTEGNARTVALEARALHGLARDEEAATAAAQAMALATAAHARGDEARAHAVLASLALAGSRHDEAERHVTAGLALADRGGMKLLAAELHGLAGAVALAEGKPAVEAFAAMRAIATEAGSPLLDALARFGEAAATPYDAGAAGLVAEAQARLEEAQRGLDDAARSRFRAEPARRRVNEGNHIAFSLPRAPRERRMPTGPLGFGFGGL